MSMLTEVPILTARVLRRWSSDPATVAQSLLFPAGLLVALNVVLGNGIKAATGHSALYGTVPLVSLIGATSGAIIVTVSMMREAQFVSICEVLGIPHVPKDPRFDSFATRATNAHEVTAIVAERLRQDTTARWLAKLGAADVLASPIHSLTQVIADPHVVATGRMTRFEQPGIGTLTFPALPGSPPVTEGPRAHAPDIGAHGARILTELGYDAAEIDRLSAARVLLGR